MSAYVPIDDYFNADAHRRELEAEQRRRRNLLLIKEASALIRPSEDELEQLEYVEPKVPDPYRITKKEHADYVSGDWLAPDDFKVLYRAMRRACIDIAEGR